MFTARCDLGHQIRYSFVLNPLNAELNPICHLLPLLGAQHFLHVSKIRVKSLTLRLLMSYIYIYIYDISSLRVKGLTEVLRSLNQTNGTNPAFISSELPRQGPANRDKTYAVYQSKSLHDQNQAV